MIFDLELFEETAEKLYNIIPQSESMVHHVYTHDRAFSKGFKYLNKKKKNVVLFNWENCVRMVWLYKFDVKKLTFISDADWKSAVLKEYLPDIKDSENYRFNFGPEVLTVLSDMFSLKFGYEGFYRNIPVNPNPIRLDFRHTTALIANF
jgi:hypothetical protein